MSYTEAGGLRRLVRRAAATPPGSWFFAHTLQPADRLAYRLTGGRTTLAALLSGLPVVMLTTTGARSGRLTTAPVLGLPDGDALILVGSNFGRARHPAWVHNLRAAPRAFVEIGGTGREVEAEEVEGRERERYLALAAELYPGFRDYARRAAPRRIAVMRLIPCRGI